VSNIREIPWALALTLFFVAPAAGQALHPGTLTGSIVSRSDARHRYAVYLPSTYDRAKPAPILFVLDYRGRARVAADVFVPAAERFGWIVISSSNTASDEAPRPTLEALQVMWSDAHALFSIDDRRTYLAGLSGTARTATWLASQLEGTFTGVIGAAAGFAPAAPPSRNTRFLYYGTVGDEDYNYWEMRQLETQLSKLQVPHRIETFSGTHGWMPPPIAMAAVEWMELHAMRSGRRETDPALVDFSWDRDLHAVQTLEELGRPLGVLRRLEAMSRDYEGLRPADELASIATRARSLAAEPGVAREIRAHNTSAAAHDSRVSLAMQVLADAFPPGADAPAAPLAGVLASLDISRLMATASGRDHVAAFNARRILAELDVQTGFYLPVEAMREQDDERAMFYLDIARAINPGDPFAWYLRGSLFARARRPTEAIGALTRAVELGFRTPDALTHDKSFDAIRSREDFQALLARVRAEWDAKEK